jgi:GTP pyrophosphokinase
MKLDVVAIAAGLLHDIVEDTQTPIERIKELFGPDVAHVVEGVTKLGAIRSSPSEERQAENFRKMLLAMVDDIRVIWSSSPIGCTTCGRFITCLRSAASRSRRDARHLCPIANRLGMSKIKERARRAGVLSGAPRVRGLRQVEKRRRATEG